MNKSVLFGLHEAQAGTFLSMRAYFDDTKPIVIVSENEQDHGMIYKDLPVISFEKFRTSNLPQICAKFFLGTADNKWIETIVTTLIVQFRVDASRIFNLTKAKQHLLNKVLAKYANTKDPEIQDIVRLWQGKNQTNSYGSYIAREFMDKPQKIMRDDDGFPYIDFFGKKMFFPKDWWQIQKDADGAEIIRDQLMEQHEGSPHIYIDEKFLFSERLKGGVIVDAGVCEGNFALRYVEEAKKVYLVESEEQWQEPLRRTFAPFADKVVFCNKFLGRVDSYTTTTLDNLTKGEPIDFFKADIEGAEIDAVLGAKRTLARSDAQIALCAYHRQYDEENLRVLLRALGYDVSHSSGYMFFEYDADIAASLDFRRGVVYGRRPLP